MNADAAEVAAAEVMDETSPCSSHASPSSLWCKSWALLPAPPRGRSSSGVAGLRTLHIRKNEKRGGRQDVHLREVSGFRLTQQRYWMSPATQVSVVVVPSVRRLA